MPSNPPSPSILHIGACPSTMDGDIAAALTESFEVCHCNDVYLAIVRLMRPKADGNLPVAVIVSLDSLEHAELEFFGIVARFMPNLPVLVFSRSGQSELVTRAVELGATGPATEESIKALAGRLVTPAAAFPTDESPLHEEAESMPRIPTSEAAFTVGELPTALEDEEDELEEIRDDDGQHDGLANGQDGDEEPTKPVRVPWLRYADVPMRSAPPTPPQSEPFGPSIPTPVGGDADRIDQHTPLLTEEELRALMGPAELDDEETGLGQGDDGEHDGRQELER